jgi:hypothetical protein
VLTGVKVTDEKLLTPKVTFGVVGSEKHTISGVEPAGTIPTKTKVLIPPPAGVNTVVEELVWILGLLLSPFCGVI